MTGCSCTAAGPGFGVYEAQFARDGQRLVHHGVLVSGDRSACRRASDACDAVFAEAIIDGALLGNWDTDAWTRLRSMPREQP